MSAFTGSLEPDPYPVSAEPEPYHHSSQLEHHQSHGFGYPAASTHDTSSFAPNSISIKAPTHEDMMAAGKFPEPSPAACGKRKVAEIAAAQMLVGVGFSPNPVNVSKRPSIEGAAPQDVLDDTPHSHFGQEMPFQTEDDAFLAEVFGVDGDRATPPPSEMEEGGFGMSLGRGMSLQIVNPDTLVEEDEGYPVRKRFINGQASPSTPWDGQLEALVR
jgi:hypothetical protein